MASPHRFLAPVVQALCLLAATVLSGGAWAQTSPTVDWRYTVRPQDTLSSLARQYLKPSVTWQALAKHNRLPDDGSIQVGAQLRMPLQWLAVQQAQAKLIALSGDVQIQTLQGEWRPAQLGQALQTGQHIRVGALSNARLQFADASELVMQPQSTLALDTLSVYAGGYMADTQLRLQSGRVELQVNPQGRQGQKFDVVTPAAVASVRGTQFVVDVQGQGRTVQQTSEGQVELQTAQGQVLVQAGFGSVVAPGEKPTPPQRIKPAPQLQNPVARFVDFPLVFDWHDPGEVSHWVLQVGRDPQMSQLVLTQQTSQPTFDAGVLADGRYHMRAWTLDSQGLPSLILQHPFEVDIPRRLQGPVIQLAARHLSAGAMTLELAPLPPGQRYLVQLTQDAQGRQVVWHQATQVPTLRLPQLPAQDLPYHLWIWVY